MMRIFTILLFFILASYSRAATVVTDVDGGKLEVEDKDGNKKTVNEGEEIPDGSNITLSKDQSATVSLETGMDVVVAPETKVKVSTDEDDTPLVAVLFGEVRSYLSPSETKEKKPRLKVITPTAVIGVRGTDFVVNSKDGSTDVHTLEGSVEVAHSRDELAAGKTTHIDQGEAITGHRAGGSFTKQTFNREQFEKEFQNRHPRMVAMRQRAQARRQQFHTAIMKRRQRLIQRQAIKKNKAAVMTEEERKAKRKERRRRRQSGEK